jgi:hypothetical protein
MDVLLCRGSGLPVFLRLAPANSHDASFAQPLLSLAVRLYGLRPCVVCLDAAYWGPTLIAWIHTVLRPVAVVPRKPKRTKNRTCLALAYPATIAVPLAATAVGRPALIRSPKRVRAPCGDGRL